MQDLEGETRHLFGFSRGFRAVGLGFLVSGMGFRACFVWVSCC